MKLSNEGHLELGKGVNLKPYQKRAFIQREYLTENEIRSYVGTDLILDGESYPNYFMCGFKHVQTGKYIKIERNFNPFFLSFLLMSYRTIGFNSLPYDLPVLWASYTNRDPAYIKDVSNALIQSGKRTSEIEKEFNFKCYPLQPRQHIDLFNVCPLKQSLKMYGARLHSKRIQDLPIPDTKYLTEEEIEIICEYNCNDLDVTELIFKFVKERLELREAISIEYNLDLMSKSDAQMAEAVISKEVGKLNGKWVKRPEIEAGTTFQYKCPQFLMFATHQMQTIFEKIKRINFVIQDNGKIGAPPELADKIQVGDVWYSLGIGGLHSYDKCTAYEANEEYALIDIDVVSYYPRAIVSLGLYPVAMGPNFLKVYDGFRLTRIQAKKLKQTTKANGLKIFLNGASGKFSDFFSTLYSPWNTIHLNLTGQLSILMLAEMVTCQGMKVVSANTDGLTVYCKRSELDKLNHWIKYWENLTSFEMEQSEYKAYYSRDINAYFAVKEDGSVKVKGPYSEIGSQSGTQLDNNPVMLICSDAIKALLSKGIAIEETIRNCCDIARFVIVRNVKGGAHKDGYYLGKVVRWAYYKNIIGTINYVMTNNKVPTTEGAMPLQDLPDEFPIDKIDYDRYIQETKNILMDVGYIKRAKQLEFF